MKIWTSLTRRTASQCSLQNSVPIPPDVFWVTFWTFPWESHCSVSSESCFSSQVLMPQSREVGQAAPQLLETCAVWMHGALPLGHGSLQSLLVPSCCWRLELRSQASPPHSSCPRCDVSIQAGNHPRSPHCARFWCVQGLVTTVLVRYRQSPNWVQTSATTGYWL